MKWVNVKLIFQREVRDQLRDRRTLFMIAVLPILLYPLMGMVLLQFAQFIQAHPSKIMVLGMQHLPSQPALFVGDGIVPDLSPEHEQLIEIVVDDTPVVRLDDAAAVANQELYAGAIDAVIFFPANFAEQLASNQQTPSEQTLDPEIFYDSASDRSRMAADRMRDVLDVWRARLVEQYLRVRRIPVSAARPFDISNNDVAMESNRRAAIWSKILPFVVIVWSLTGAFYPAIDLCAGEKERGTLETLLSSPAERREIVWGKLLTTMLFSVTTALLNLVSMTVTGVFLISRLDLGNNMAKLVSFGAPPLSTMGWLVLSLIPLSAMFSALSLALAALARSTKEGQYYLMPLFLITVPLAILPMMPTTEISIGNSLVPVTGIMLLLRVLMEGDYLLAVKYAVPVLVVTGFCCLLAIRWAVNQFNDESVLFRESERFELGLWIRHLVRDRGDLPSVAEAFMCGVLLLLIRFIAGMVVTAPDSWHDVMTSGLIIQLAFVLSPVLLMSLFLTASPKRTLLLHAPSTPSVLMALLLALFLHPAATGLGELIRHIYPFSQNTLAQLERFGKLLEEAPKMQLFISLALVPAICEELAFRGFILSGLRKLGHSGTAILITSIFFGIVHGILQQSIAATILGLLLGYIAVQTRSIIPCMIFHAAHNGLQLVSGMILNESFIEQHPRLERFVMDSIIESGYVYSWPVIAFSVLSAGLTLYWFRRQPFQPSAEERLQTAIDKQSTSAGVSHV
jgi:sodium transport system permease protein